MKIEEAKKLVDTLKIMGASDKESLNTFYNMYLEEKINIEQFEVFAGLIGFELTSDFKKMSDKERRSHNFEYFFNK